MEYFKVKWVDIAEEGSTWEPAASFQGDAAKTALANFRQERAAYASKVEAAKAARRAGKQPAPTSAARNPQVEADNAADNASDEVVIADNPNGITSHKHAAFRRKQSWVWRWYGPKFYCQERGGYYVKCKICAEVVKHVNTTNLAFHLNGKHPKEMCDDKTGKVRAV